ncbi:MAG: response regulator, partial [Bdellovibrio sp.]|nr:response regulator [Bdellovibrio sp.]
LSMIEDLIDLAKSETNELQVQPKRVNLMGFLNEVAKISGQDCSKKGLRLYTQYSPELPTAVKCDPSRLRQILLNLLRNACKYTNHGHVILRVSTEPHPNPLHTILKFEVEDTGVGIQQDKLQQVFDAFFQVENSYALSEGGVGLGLAIVKELVKKLNGTVSVRSTPKKGSSFEVVLEMEVLDASPWTESFRNPTDTVRDLILISPDELLATSLWPLGLHPTIIFNHVKLLNELGPMIGTTKDHNKWFLLDETRNHFSAVDIDHLQRLGNVILLGDRDALLAKHPGLNAPILSSHPVLISDIMTASGFVIKATRRAERDGKEQSAAANRKAGLPDDLKILVADDDMGNQELYQAYFDEKPWNIKYTLNGAEAYDSFKQNPPQVVILDVRMPVMDGFEAAAKIRQYEKSRGLHECPILLVTADALEETMEQAHEISNVKFLTKPIRKSVLMDSLSQSVK